MRRVVACLSEGNDSAYLCGKSVVNRVHPVF
ncbi:hypothetical protein B1526_0666 [Bifidobacterium criceti]|uniref:Uncharacterized protein n=1 Tax=Bifidobacterium criceti TaxID=1960969 RepID=A0A2A2EHK5_9BIFI|nr:hypothetical protein B1526_0666 [Bifidobacterium criceti]